MKQMQDQSSKLKKYEIQYNQQAEKRKAKIRQEPKKFKRFWKWVLYFILFPWIWIFYNIRDWRTLILFGLVCAVVGCEVWVPLLLGLIFKNGWLLGIAATCEAFWLAPFTPFLPLCIVITFTIKEFLINKRHKKKDIA